MKKLTAVLMGLGIMFAAAGAMAKPRGPVSGPEAKAHLNERLKFSSKITDKTTTFRTKLGGSKGDKIRPFTANNIHSITIPGRAPSGALGGARLTVGNNASGTLNTKTGEVRVKSVSSPKNF